MEKVTKIANKFWDWFSNLDDAYFLLASVAILFGVVLYLLKVFWDTQDKIAVARINAIFDSVKKSPVGRMVIIIFAFLGFASNDTDNNNHSS